MRFKAKLTPEHVELLHNLISPISRLTPTSNTTTNSTSHSEGTTLGGTMVYLDNDKLILSTRGGSSASTHSTSTSHSSSSGGGGTSQSDANMSTQTGGGGNNDAEGIFCFAELITTRGIFRDHVIESVERDNAILMEVCLVQWRTALRSVLAGDTRKKGRSAAGAGGGGGVGELIGDQTQNSRRSSTNDAGGGGGIVGGYEVTIKLAKRNGGLPHLCIDSKGVGGMTMIEVHHAVPVRIRKVEELQYHVPPRMGMPDVQLELPRERPIRNVVERLRAISPHVYIEGSMAGVLTFRIDGDGSSIRTTYNKLIAIREDTKQTSQDDDDNTQTQETQTNNLTSNSHRNGTNNAEPLKKCILKLDTKKLHASLHWQASLSSIRDVSSAVLCMWENEMLVLDVTLNPEIGRFMYYVPVHYLSEEWAIYEDLKQTSQDEDGNHLIKKSTGETTTRKISITIIQAYDEK